MEKKAPKVSVILPTYKRPDYFREALNSVINQTFSDYEIIVVDDGTPGDENKKICDAFPKVKYHKITNSGGPIIPRNTGLALAKGKYIAFLDDDDIWLPEKLSFQVDILENNPDYGLVHGYCKVIDNEGKETGEIVGRLRDSRLKHGYVFDRMVGNFTVMLSSALIKKEIIEKTGPFDENIPAAGEDMEFFTRIAFYTQFFYLDRPLLFYRVHEEGISRNNYAYNYLPLVLFRTVKKLKQKEGISYRRFHKIRGQLLRQQTSMANCNKTYKTALSNAFKISFFFFLHPRVVWGFILRFPNLFKVR